MSDYNLQAKSTIKDKQLHFLSKEVADLNPIDTQDQAMFADYVRSVYAGYEENGTPLFRPIPVVRHQLPWREDVLKNFREIHQDLNILNEEQDAIGTFLVDSFNTVYSEEKRLTNRVASLKNLIGDLNLVTSNESDHVIYLKDSFQNQNTLDTDFILDGVATAHLSAQEGILTLAHTGSVNLSEAARVAQIQGNGTPGASQLVRKFTLRNAYNEDTETFHYLDRVDKDYHRQPDALLDNRPDTVFEYQLINVPTSFKTARRFYDFDWAKGDKEGEVLRLKLTFDLGQIQALNWIGLAPYFPYGSTGRMLIHSINVSADGFEYEPLYPHRRILNQELANIRSSHHLEELFTGNTDPALASYTGEGVWVFPEKQVRYIEIVLDQDQSYTEIVGQSAYSISLENDDSKRVYIPAPEELKDAEPGEYVRSAYGERTKYHKEIDVTTEGWRYAIGLRDVYFMQYTYTEKSLFVSKRQEVKGDIQRVMLYANEIIPKEYQTLVAEMNDWITYEVSFDDLAWYRLSPMHHEPVNNQFPPKILEVNGRTFTEERIFQIHRQAIQTEEPATGVRWRATLRRPEGREFDGTTPVLHDVALKLELRRENV